MSKVKKNVFQEFMQDDFIPEGDQYIVKYVAGRGNNLHEVEDIHGSTYLVSMPKKFRQTVWLKKNDCIVVDPIAEGKKVLGEIVCVIPLKNVISMVQAGEWCPKMTGGTDKDAIIDFFKKHLQSNSNDKSNNGNDMIPSDSDEDLDDEDEQSGTEDEEDSEDDGVSEENES